jgi:hypothetical protein
MSTDFPTNTIILITAAIAGTGAVVWFALSETLRRLPLAPQVKRNWRWGTALVLSAWLLVRLALEVAPPDGQLLGTVPTIGFVVFGIFVGTLPLAISPAFRQIVRATPATWIIGIHAVRVVGGLFLSLNDMKLLPAAFALPAGYGDVTVAVLSLVVIYLLAENKPYARAVAIVWNLLGLLDLVTALITGTINIAPFATQLAATGVSPLYLNYVLIIPAYGVPLVGVLHIYSLYQMFTKRVDVTKQDTQDTTDSVQAPNFAQVRN